MSGLTIFVHQPWGARHNSISPAPGQSYKEHHNDAHAHMCDAAQTQGGNGCYQPVGLKSLCVAALRIVSPRKVVALTLALHAPTRTSLRGVLDGYI